MDTGIYTITHTPTARQYVGSSKIIRSRWSAHRKDLNNGSHHSAFLQRCWSKYESHEFEFEVLLVCRPEHLLLYEQRAIDALKPVFNMSPTAGSPLGVKHTPQSKANIRKALLERNARQPELLQRFIAGGQESLKRRLADPDTRAQHIERCVKMAKEKNVRLITYKGKAQSITSWAKEFGLPPQLVVKRLNTLKWGIERALTTPARNKQRLIAYNGQTKSLKEWAGDLNISAPGLRDRIERLGVEAAMELPYTDKNDREAMRAKVVRMGRALYEYEGQPHTLSELAEKLDVGVKTLFAYLQTHTPEQAIAFYTKKNRFGALAKTAKQLGVAESAFRKYARTHGVEKAIQYYTEKAKRGVA